ncbi:hypothetical protein [Kitasatospora purpeofusca]|uniref:hypothetical protein n=1 Tax=Kitasatospora purpeofusca TaxID=67352 RepID=UPI003F4AC0A7
MKSADEESIRAEYEGLARRVRNELVAAGLPVIVPELSPELAVGAQVRLDMVDYLFHGGLPKVLVSWKVSPQLRSNAGEDVRQGRGVTPAVRQCGEVCIAMCGAVVAILSAAGFTAREHDNDMSPFDVLVLASPEPGAMPGWAFPDVNLALPGGSESG